jgi:hypothetical protein
MSFESFIEKGLFFIKRLTWKFIRSFACVDSNMAEAKLPCPLTWRLKKMVGLEGD